MRTSLNHITEFAELLWNVFRDSVPNKITSLIRKLTT